MTAPAEPSGEKPRPHRDGDFRWQALFQHSSDALFVLSRRRSLLFVNRAWEALTELSLTEVRGLTCRRPRPASPSDSFTDILAHALYPPAEVLRGQFARARRLLPAAGGVRWWDVEFLPLRQEAGVIAIIGRILPVAAPSSADSTPAIPEKMLALRERVAQRFDFSLLDGVSPALVRLKGQVQLALQVQTPVLLVGESGTGKATLARVIHFQSGARERAFAALDATRLPPSRLADVLFGDPGTERIGAIYLREPGHLPRELQARLAARLVGEREKPTARILAGCCGDPAAAVREGRLVHELYALLSPLTINVPRLQERLDDLPLLVERLLARANEDGERVITRLSPEAWEIVRAYSWPGNLGELLAVLSAARARAAGEQIGAADLPAPLRLAARMGQMPGRGTEKPLPLDELLEETERRLIRLALARAAGNKGRAAELLGVFRQRLLRRMEALGFQEP